MLFASFVRPAPSDGLPLFSREHPDQCMRCHSAYPRLNPAGLRFMQDGYRAHSIGEDSERESGSVPISLSGDLGYGLTSTHAAGLGLRGRRSVGEVPRRSLGLQSAGTLSGRIAFDLATEFDPDAHAIRTTNAFVQLDDVVRRGGLNLKLGRFDAGPAFLSSRRRTTIRDYLSPVELEARGLELNGARAAWSYGAGMMSSQRTLPAARPGARAFDRLEDTYLWVTRDVRGQQLGARMLFDRQDSNLPALAWLQHLQAQGSALLEFGRFAVTPAYTFDRFDDRPSAGMHERHQYAMLEALAMLGQDRRWALTAHMEHEYVTRNRLTREQDRDLEVLDLAHYFRANTRVSLECAHSGDNVGGPGVTSFNAGIHVAY